MEAADTNCIMLVSDEAFGRCIVTSLPRIEWVGSGNTANVEPRMVGASRCLAWPVSTVSVQSTDLRILPEDSHDKQSAIGKKRIVLRLSASGQRNSNNCGLRGIVRFLSNTISSL